MARKPAMLAMAIGLLMALAAPTAARAAQLTMPEGVTVSVPTDITLTSTDWQITDVAEFMGGGNVECENAHLTGTVQQNDGTTVTAAGMGEATENHFEGCETSTGFNVTIEEPTLEHLETVETGTGTVKLTFIMNVHDVVKCHYTVEAPFHYASGSDQIHITSTKATSTSEPCEEPEIHGTFTLETKNGGGPVILD